MSGTNISPGSSTTRPTIPGNVPFLATRPARYIASAILELVLAGREYSTIPLLLRCNFPRGNLLLFYEPCSYRRPSCSVHIHRLDGSDSAVEFRDSL